MKGTEELGHSVVEQMTHSIGIKHVLLDRIHTATAESQLF